MVQSVWLLPRPQHSTGDWAWDWASQKFLTSQRPGKLRAKQKDDDVSILQFERSQKIFVTTALLNKYTFKVVVVQWWQGIIETGAMQEQSYCFSY